MKKIIILFMITVLFPFVATAVENQDNGPLKGIERLSPSNWESNVPVWTIGKIDSLSKDSIVIDDIKYNFSKSLKCYLENGKEITINKFSESTLSKFVLAPGKRNTITIMIKMDK